MGKERKGTGNVKYAVKNIGAALLFGIAAFMAGSLATFVGQIALIILGVACIIQALGAIGEVSPSGPITGIVMGVFFIVASNWLDDFDIFQKVSYCLMDVIIIFVGRRQFSKTKDRYGEDTSLQRAMKVSSYIIPLFLVIGGGLLLASTVLSFFHPMPALGTVGGWLCFVGAVVWIVYTVMALVAVKRKYTCINDYRGSSGGRRASAASSTGRTSGGADYSKVRSEMSSLANAMSGGSDYVGSGGGKITYRVSVSMSGREIDFRLRYDLSGEVRESDLTKVQEKIVSLIKQRQQLVLEKASQRLNSIKPDQDYEIGVEIVS